MHGCPAGEIERMADHLLGKGLHTQVKCNPTMLGYPVARGLLDDLGYAHLTFDDHHFADDLQLADAVAMFTRLQQRAHAAGLVFGVKLSNTLPTDVNRGELPAAEMYLSGRALLPLTLTLAATLSRAFDGLLPVSYAGGADATNVADLVRAGIQPVTVCTTLLKPGGYARLRQLAELSTAVMTDHDRVDVDAVDALVARVTADPRTHKRHREKVGSRKTRSPLRAHRLLHRAVRARGLPDRAAGADLPGPRAAGRQHDAFRVIARDNTAPTITGVLCSEPCRQHCTRLDYDAGVDIRGVKLVAADAAQDDFIASMALCPPTVDGARGGGRCRPGGDRRRDVPAAQRDRRRRLRAAGRPLRHRAADHPRLPDHPGAGRARLPARRGHRGELPLRLRPRLRPRRPAQPVRPRRAGHRGLGPRRQPRRSAAAPLVRDALDFLWEAQTPGGPRAGRRVAVIGAGDVAMDCARTALRTDGVEHVTLVYRRTEPFMPAAQEDVNAVRAEGIEVLELLAPVSYDGAVLRCERTELGAWADDGRRSTRGTGVLRRPRRSTR